MEKTLVGAFLRWAFFSLSAREAIMRTVNLLLFFVAGVPTLLILLIKTSPELRDLRDLPLLDLVFIVAPIATLIAYRIVIDDLVVPKYKHNEEKTRAFYMGKWNTIEQLGTRVGDVKTSVGKITVYKIGDHVDLVPWDKEKIDLEEWRDFRAKAVRSKPDFNTLEDWINALKEL